MIFLTHTRLPMLLVAAGMVAAYVYTTAWPARYSASARVTLPGQALADFLRDERVSLAMPGDNLTVMVAGSVMQDPLELLRRPRLEY